MKLGIEQQLYLQTEQATLLYLVQTTSNWAMKFLFE